MEKFKKQASFRKGMFFDITPKVRKEDLFGMDYYLEQFRSYLLDPTVRMIVIKGLRRVGKTSLLNVGLRTSGQQFIRIDVRDAPFQDKKEFMLFLIGKIKEARREDWERIIQKIAKVGLGYRQFSLELFFSQDEKVNSFFENLNKELQKKKETLIIALDEAQLLKKIGFDYFLASVFDNYRSIKIVITGSEIGLINKFLGKEEYEAPLFGRAHLEISIGKIKEEMVAKFLEAGFAQLGQKISFEEVRDVIENFDGLIGWVTYYGWYRSKNFSHEKAIEKVKEEGRIIITKELENFLAMRKSRSNYIRTIKYLAKGFNTWSLLKQHFQKAGIKLSDSQVDLYLKELIEFGFIDKINEQYFLVDPLLSSL